MAKAFKADSNGLIEMNWDPVTRIVGSLGIYTKIDFAKKTYSTMTFAEMKQAMEDAMSRMQKGNDKADVKWDVKAKATGQTKTIQGLEAKEIITTMTMAATDKQSGQSGSMNTEMDTWIASSVPGYDEVRAFHRKMGEKMGYLFGSSMAQMGMMRPDAAKGLAEAGKEMAKLDGMPVLRIVRTGGAADGQPAAQGERQQPASGPAAIGRLAGGLGGFGRKKKEEPPPASGEQPASSGSTYAMEITTELTSYSSTPVDTSKFEVPAGFKEVEHSMKRRK